MRSTISEIINSTKSAAKHMTSDEGPVISWFIVYAMWTLVFPVVLALDIYLIDEVFDEDNFYHVTLLMIFVVLIDVPQVIIIFGLLWFSLF